MGFPVSSSLANLEFFATLSVLGVAAILAAVSLLSYRRLRHPRAFFIGLGFVVIAVEGAWLVGESYRLRGSEAWLLTVALFNLVALLFLYLALRIK